MEYVNSTIQSLIKTDVDALKYKAIQKYMVLVKYLELGKKVDQQDILEIISLIDVYSELDSRRIYYKEYYLNA